jgi:hypothetical protein
MLQSILKNKLLIALLLPLYAFSQPSEKSIPTGSVDSSLCYTWIITSQLFHKVEGVRLVHGVESPSTITFNSDGTFIIQTMKDVKGHWNYTKGSQLLTLTYNQQEELYQILQISPEELIIKKKEREQRSAKEECLVRAE